MGTGMDTGKEEATSQHHHHRGRQTLHNDVTQAWGAVAVNEKEWETRVTTALALVCKTRSFSTPFYFSGVEENLWTTPPQASSLLGGREKIMPGHAVPRCNYTYTVIKDNASNNTATTLRYVGASFPRIRIMRLAMPDGLSQRVTRHASPSCLLVLPLLSFFLLSLSLAVYICTYVYCIS